jgi:hypothetical protein
MKKNIFSILIIIAALAFCFVAKTNADSSFNTTGWAWGGAEDCDLDKNTFLDVACGGDNIASLIPSDLDEDNSITGNENAVGLISMNSSNCDSDGNGVSDAGNYSDCPIGIAVANYGVNIPSTFAGGDVTGYAWNESLGYIDFNPQDHCGSAYNLGFAATCVDPDGGNGGVRRVGNTLEGWARVVSSATGQAAGNSGGWAGWIKMKGNNHGVILDFAGNLSGYASAGSDEFGWISFNGVKTASCTASYTCTHVSIDGVCDSTNCNEKPIIGEAYCDDGCGTVVRSAGMCGSDACVDTEDAVSCGNEACAVSTWNWKEVEP